jgi:hypothetical protein
MLKGTLCKGCELYSKGLGRCKRGKANPATLQGAKDVVKWGNLCLRSPFIDEILNPKEEN